jgi:hypothetical protein
VYVCRLSFCDAERACGSSTLSMNRSGVHATTLFSRVRGPTDAVAIARQRPGKAVSKEILGNTTGAWPRFPLGIPAPLSAFAVGACPPVVHRGGTPVRTYHGRVVWRDPRVPRRGAFCVESSRINLRINFASEYRPRSLQSGALRGCFRVSRPPARQTLSAPLMPAHARVAKNIAPKLRTKPHRAHQSFR